MNLSSIPSDLRKLLELSDKNDFLLVVPFFLLVDGLIGMGSLELFFSFLIPDVEGVGDDDGSSRFLFDSF